MELYLLTTLLLVLMDPGIMKIEARFDISSRTVVNEGNNSDSNCLKQTALLTHDDLNEVCGFQHPEQRIGTKIINGKQAKPGQFPFAVKITNNTMNGYHICGGSIIDSKHILTAAHCITVDGTRTLSDVKQLTIEVGAHFFNLSSQNSDCRIKHNAKVLHIHPLYLNPTQAYDIGIIELEEPINFEYYKGGYGSRGPICLATGEEDLVEVGEELSVAGWGLTSIFGHIPKSLNFDSYRRLNQTDCINSFDHEICTKGSSIHKSFYSGDSGSALFTTNDSGSYVQVGIVSRLDKCLKLPILLEYQSYNICFNMIYTRVDFHLKWIDSVIIQNPIPQ